jgi:hypothetical protein
MFVKDKSPGRNEASQSQQKLNELYDRNRNAWAKNSQSPRIWSKAARGNTPDNARDFRSWADHAVPSWRHAGQVPVMRNDIDHDKTSKRA